MSLPGRCRGLPWRAAVFARVAGKGVGYPFIMGNGEGTAGNPGQVRLTDRIGIGVLTRLVPRDLVDEVIAEAGRQEQRQRLLPARVVVYYVLALCLFFGEGYEEVMRAAGRRAAVHALVGHRVDGADNRGDLPGAAAAG